MVRTLFLAALAASAAAPAASRSLLWGGGGRDAAAGVEPADAERAAFASWAARHGRAYVPGSNMLGATDEFEARLSVYRDNAAFVRQLAARGLNGTWEASTEGPFMDRTAVEFAALLRPMARAAPPAPAPAFSHAGVAAADAVDWVAKGAVTPVKNQGMCGSCWSFSTTGSVEGVNFLATGELVSVSEQQLVSCDRGGGDMGCSGGLMDYAFKYIIGNGGLDTESDYPYASGAGASPACDAAKAKDHAVTIDGEEDVPANDEGALRKAITAHPVSVAVDAQLWQFYGGGVFDGVLGYCGTQLDHGVLAVGYDTSDGKTGTYKIKNSWGPTWGEAGYIRIPMNRGQKGMCGVAAAASYPTKKGALAHLQGAAAN